MNNESVVGKAVEGWTEEEKRRLEAIQYAMSFGGQKMVWELIDDAKEILDYIQTGQVDVD